MADSITGSITTAYSEIYNIANQAFSNLTLASAGGYVDNSPAAFSQTTLKFDPGQPNVIKYVSPVQIDNLLRTVDTYISKISNISGPNIPNIPNFSTNPYETDIYALLKIK